MHNEIVHQFLQTHPEECAREMERFSLDDILFFIKQLSKKETVLLFTSLIPSIAAVCLQNLSIEESMSITQDLSLNALKKILPRVHLDLRTSLMESLPKNQQIALQHALQFSEQTVGAFMNTQVLFLPVHHSVAQSLTFIQKFPEEITPCIFCINNRGELQGMLTLKDLMIASPSQPVSHVMTPCPMVLMTDTSVASVAFLEVWEKQNVLPVTDEQHILVGVLEYNKIVKELQSIILSDRKENLVDSFAHIMFMFSHTTEDILNEISQLASITQKGN